MPLPFTTPDPLPTALKLAAPYVATRQPVWSFWSLDALATHFEARAAADEVNQGKAVYGSTEYANSYARAATWRWAASIVRNTRIAP